MHSAENAAAAAFPSPASARPVECGGIAGIRGKDELCASLSGLAHVVVTTCRLYTVQRNNINMYRTTLLRACIERALAVQELSNTRGREYGLLHAP